MPKIEIYTSALCGYSHRAKALLKQKGIKFDETDVTFSPKKRKEMENRARRCTVPQIFIDDKSVGGSDELYGLDQAGELDKLLGL